MRADAPVPYVCPYTHEPLELRVDEVADGLVRSGSLLAPDGRSFLIEAGVPHLIDFARESFSSAEQRESAFYESQAAHYDAIMDWIFASFCENESEIREAMIDELRLTVDGAVLETGCGTCRDSLRIAHRLGGAGRLYLQDLSPEMLRIGRTRVENVRRQSPIECEIEFFSGNALTLPFSADSFDAAFHFGGINVFGSYARAVGEMSRVVRPGGRVVFGDEGLAPWLRSTEFGRILTTSSPMYEHQVPLDAVPPCARDAAVRWLIGNAYYLVSFTVTEGVPPLDLDLPILGVRGGTHRTRNFGMLEGVTPDTKQRVIEAARREGLSVHDWLERALSALVIRCDQ